MYPICPKTSILWFWKFDKFILDHCINGEKMVKVRDIYIETKKTDQGKQFSSTHVKLVVEGGRVDQITKE